MFFYLSKILSFMLMPLTWVLILLFLALLLRKKKVSYRLLLLAFLALYIFSNPFVADEVVRLWEVPIVRYDQLDKQYDVGIVLGGGMITIDKKNDRLTFRDNVDRIMQAVKLYKDGKIKRILISGGSGSLVYRDQKESELLKKYLVDTGFDAYDIIIENESDNTYENVRNTSEILKRDYPGQSYLLITSSLHVRRAKACFERKGLQVTVYPTNKITGDRRFQFSHLFLPEVGSLEKWNMVLHEMFGIIVYKVMRYA